jgi:hypothetical protein
MPLFLRVIQHLLPHALAWRLTVVTKALRKFFEGIAAFFGDVREFIDLVFFDLFPETTREVQRWEAQFGLARPLAEPPENYFFTVLQAAGCLAHFDLSDPASVFLANASIANGSDLATPGWTHTDVTASLNQDGLGGTRFTVSTATAPQASQNITNCGVNATANPPCAIAVKYKSGTIPFLLVETRSGTAANRTWINLGTHAVGTSGASHSVSAPSAPDGDGYRTVVVTMNANGGTPKVQFSFVNADNSTTAASVGQTIWLKTATVSQTRVRGLRNRITGQWWLQLTNNNQPGYEAIGVNGLPAMRSYIAGSAAHYLQSTEASVLAAFTGDDKPWTIVASVLPRQNIATESSTLFSAYSAASDNFTGLLQDNGGIGPWTVHRRDGVTLEAEQSSTHGGAGTARVVGAWFTGTAVSLTLDGATPSPNGSLSSRAALAPTTMRLLAYGSNGGGNMSLGTLAIWARSLNAGEFETVSEALGRKYSIPAAQGEPIDLDAQRRARLTASWGARGGQSKAYIQGVLDSLDLDVTVHDWWVSGPPWVARDPRAFINQPDTGREPHYVVNQDLNGTAQPAVPSDPAKWPFFLYFGGATMPEPAYVLARRRSEFETQVLKMKPAHLWAVMHVTYLYHFAAFSLGTAISERAVGEEAIAA